MENNITLKLAESVIKTHKLIKLIHDVVRDPVNYDYLAAGQFKDVHNFLMYSTECLLEFSQNKMTWSEVIKCLDLCEHGYSHFSWYCDEEGC